MIIQNTNASQPPTTGLRNVSDNHPGSIASSNAPATAVQAEKAPARQPTAEQLSEAVEVINSVLRQSGNSLEFSIDNDTRKSIVKLVDTNTGELIRQYPSDETLAISRSIDRFQQGLLLRQKA